MFKSTMKPSQISKELEKVEHKTFQEKKSIYWVVENGSIQGQSICWLFCWAKTGMGSKKAQGQAYSAFNAILGTKAQDLFKQLDAQKGFHEWAQDARYSEKNVDSELKQKSKGLLG